ncbi:uncharacterized protein LOC135346177 isoform X2 [Halichondria panicea]|uniref:uncharacterized protein LOC135346177 isoform X2 n=1 Tax=Halichondria panicea TaxID=6063 RepID=UPI00312B62F3
MAINTKYQNLFEFCIQGDRIGLADYIITNSCNPSAYDARDINGRTALHIACQHGHLFTVRSLIEVFGCSSTIVDKSGNLPFHVACLYGHLPIVDYLFSLVANEDISTAVFQTDSEGNNLLHKACQSGSVSTVRYILQLVGYPKKDLICKKLNLYQDSISVYNAASIETTSLCQVQSVIKCITKQNTLGDTPIHVACRHGHLKVLKIFQVYFPYSNLLESLFLIAIVCNNMSIINYFKALKNTTVLDFNSEEPGLCKCEKIDSRQRFRLITSLGLREDRELFRDRTMYRRKNVHPMESAICERCQDRLTVLSIPAFNRSTSMGHCPFCNEKGNYKREFSFHCESCSSVLASDKIVRVNCLLCKSLKLTLSALEDPAHLRLVHPLQTHKHPKGPSQAAALCGNLEPYRQAQMMFSSTEKYLFHAACISDNVELVKHIMETLNVGINELDSEDNTPLHVVCEWGSCKVFSFLLSFSNLQMTKINKFDQTPLSLAAKHSRIDFVTKLLECDIKNDGNSFHLACGTGNIDLVKDLTQCKDDTLINHVDKYGETPIFDACRGGHLELIKFLVTKGCNPLFINKQTKETPIHIACRMNRPDILEALCQSQLINEQSLESNICGISPIHLAIENNCFELIQIIVKYCSINLNQPINEKQATLVHCAVQMDDIGLINYLLQQPSVNWNAQDSDGNTALHLACIDENYAIVKLVACEMKHVDSSSSAVPLHSNVCSAVSQNNVRKSPLHLVCESENTVILKHLLGKLPKACNLDKLVDADQNTVLHVAVKTGCIDTVVLLSEITSCTCKNSLGETPIHIACGSGNLKIACILFSKATDAAVYSKNGDSYLHSACRGKSLEIINFLLNKSRLNCPSLFVANEHGNTPLHVACLLGNAEMIKLLLPHCSNQIRSLNSQNHTPFCCLLIGKHPNVIMDLLSSKKMDDKWCTDAQPMLHSVVILSSSERVYELTTFLLSGKYCDPSACDKNDNTIFHSFILRFSMSSYRQPSYVYYFSSDNNLKLWNYLLEILGSEINKQNINGDTPLHMLCNIHKRSRHGGNNYSKLMIERLLAHAESNINKSLTSRNKLGKTPVQLANKQVMRLLIPYGANPEDVYFEFGPILDKFKHEHPLKPSMKIIVVGNSTAGKTTLVKAIEQLELKQGSTPIESVGGPTAGVETIGLESPDLGAVKCHDFAGQPEFESSNSAFLENSVSLDQSPIFLLLVDVSNDLDVIEKHTRYWFTFIQNHAPQQLETPPHVIILGSHSDCIDTAQHKNIEKCLASAIQSVHSTNFHVIGPFLLDCRKVDTKLQKLSKMLAKSCSSLRKTVDIDIRCHILFAYLSEWFGSKPAVKFCDIQDRIKSLTTTLSCACTIRQPNFFEISSHSESHDDILPFTKETLLELLKSLHAGGHILLLNTEPAEDCWVVMDNDWLFEKVNGTLFAPMSFDTPKLPTNTGVVSEDMLISLFGQVDIDLITAYTVYSEFCRKIEDPVTLNLIEGGCTSESQSFDHEEDPPFISDNPAEAEEILSTSGNEASDSITAQKNYYFFPGLVKCERQADVWYASSPASFNFGWYLLCNKNSFLDPRFLYVLLLRLTFTFTASTKGSSQHDLVRKCNIWKNGIHWSTTRGVEVLVEVIEQNTAVLLLVRCLKDHEIEGVKLRSQVINMILEAKDQFCSKARVTENILAECFQYPQNFQLKIPILDIAQSIAKAHVCVVDSRNKPLMLRDLLFFDPYLQIGEKLIEKLWSKECSEEEVPSIFLFELSEAQSTLVHQISKLLGVPQSDVDSYTRQKWESEPTKLLLHIYELWKVRQKKPCYENLRKVFTSHSIFCGRNPLTFTACAVYNEAKPRTGSHLLIVNPMLENVSIKHLISITWQSDQSGRSTSDCELCILRDASCSWEKIAETLELQPLMFNSDPHTRKPPQDCTSDVFKWWLTHDTSYDKTWTGLHRLLIDSNMPALAEQLYEAINSPTSSALRGSPFKNSPKPYTKRSTSSQRRKKKSSISGASNF